MKANGAGNGQRRPTKKQSRVNGGQRHGRPNLRRNGAKLRKIGKKGRRTGININVATINVKGLGEVGKKMLIEQWAEKHRIDVICVTETHHAHTSTECEKDGLYVEGERIRGDWRWYFSSGINPKDLEAVEKLKRRVTKSQQNS